ncbi:N-acetylmuramic acid 6-phosphate etherase [Limnoglobus roseus]|uniref:N-acetylmuramic acid 6-phosphate etherase n=1 Tax=Limnoglobus roseus TaxID=2598579 RepID=A0A5C1A746_9BACT|nr:N-acetylmuramic acid 6-phosphate etherase [Limnoglobus roseus]QEL14540.1 N-acetylmuramic acid 6-phosphate etherase [Limnoglobus roseus]
MLDHLQTEARNPASERLDELTSVEIVELMNREDATLAVAVATQKQAIAQAIDAIADRLGKGGRLIYCGAGTSGRLGVLDASECPPTFQTDPSQVVGLIAGGRGAMFQAVEGAEDSPEQGEADLVQLNLTANDVVCGIASSGRTPYVIGAVRHARSVGAFTLAVVCTTPSELGPEVDLPIAPVVGAEVLTGSTRLKAGTVTKMVLNMLTTGAMVRLGKAFGNLMVDLKATNRKLVARSNRIVRSVTGLDEAAVDGLLKASSGEVKTAIVAHLANVPPAEARQKLHTAGRRIRLAVGSSLKTTATVERPLRSDLVLGIDGGGTNTRTLLANAATGEILGRAEGGPSNIQSVGVETALKALDDSIDQAFRTANLPRAKVGAICLGLAGVDRQEGLDIIHSWANRSAVSETVRVSNDATLLLAAGTPDGWGLAVIAGTGSIAFVQTPDGKVGRCGGWGYTLGDEGSAYVIAHRALRAACRAHDRVGSPTVLVERFVKRMNVADAPSLIPAVYRGPWDRAAIAGMAPLVLEAAAEGDAVAGEIVRNEVADFARTAFGAVANHGLPREGLPIALAGGLLLHSELYRRLFLDELRELGVTPGVVTPVEEPAKGAVVLARRVIR